MALLDMVARRVRKVIAWLLAIGVLVLIGAGVYWVVVESGWVA